MTPTQALIKQNAELRTCIKCLAEALDTECALGLQVCRYQTERSRVLALARPA